MANGHSVIPIDESQLAKDSIQYLQSEMVYVPDNVPKGRFPTLIELRNVIQERGYELEETYDWYVTSNDDHTEIWFREENRREDTPTSFWFRRGDIIVLDIMQSLANQCGSFIVADHSGTGTILIVPDTVFGTVDITENHSGFVSVITQRIPSMIVRLDQASPEDTLFVLSQINQALRRLDYIRQYELFQTAQQGLSTYIRFLKSPDVRVRSLAFDIIAKFRERFYESSEALKAAINHEIDPDTKAQMIWAIEGLIWSGTSPSGVDQQTKAIQDNLLEICSGTSEPSPVRFAASNMMTRSQPGFLTSDMRMIFIEALIHPEAYTAKWDSVYSVSRQTLETIKKLLLHHRIDILMEALPQITLAQDAHDVLRALLDYTFFGETRSSWMASLPDTQAAERPTVDEIRFRDNLSRNWLYPANPTKLTAAELLPFQRQILEIVMMLDIPWMVHSNLLEKYGFPATRASTQAILNNLE